MISQSKLTSWQIVYRIAAVKAQTTGVSTFINTVNLYEAQFTSRVGMLLADQMARGNENFEFQLEPESFGKVRKRGIGEFKCRD